MVPSILATKLYMPPPRPREVARPRLIERLNAGLQRKLSLISAPAGFGKTTLVSTWLAGCGRPVAWLSLDPAENDPSRLLAYLVASLQTIAQHVGLETLAALQTPQPPPIELSLTALLNDIAGIQEPFVLVLDDCHVLDAGPAAQAITFLLEHLPPRMHLVIVTREDPSLPLSRLRARGQLAELRAADLRFTPAEAASFLSQVMGLALSAQDIAALEARTEGWIAGLQLAALSLQGQPDASSLIQSFSGSHRFVLDYLLEEVLQRQPEPLQTFLLCTSILDRMCGPLCDAVLCAPAGSGQATLESIERANLFIVPLDNERRWFRYHHLFADLLRQRLQQSGAARAGEAGGDLAAYHIRASDWYEQHGLELEAFQHAAAANDIERAERLMEGPGMPMHFPGVVSASLGWLASLPEVVLEARPSLWVKYGTTLLAAGQTTGVEQKLQSAESALQSAEPDARTRNLLGHIATARAMLALTRYQLDAVLIQARRALEHLDPDNLPYRATANSILASAYQFQGDRGAAGRAYAEAVALSQACGNVFTTILASIGLGEIQQANNQLYRAAETFRQVLQLAGAHPQQIIYEAQLGLARICYEWDDLEAAEQHGQESLRLARQYDQSVIDRFIVCEVFLARLKLARGDVDGAAALLAQTERRVRQHNFVYRIPEVAAAQVLTLLRQGKLAAAAQLAQAHDLPLSQARVLLAQGEPARALALLEPLLRQLEARGWQDERLKALVLHSVARQLSGDKQVAMRLLGEALALGEPDGFIRVFLDEGPPIRQLLQEGALAGVLPAYARQVLAAFSQDPAQRAAQAASVEVLSERELEVLQHIAAGRMDREIADRLYVSLHTVKAHARNIYGKLGVSNRTQAVARARELGLLPP